jgi:hypothetical protein
LLPSPSSFYHVTTKKATTVVAIAFFFGFVAAKGNDNKLPLPSSFYLL